jgi:uncharacterized membrane protein YheB (UPF0754 family)
MNYFVTIATVVIVGAVIGGVTNALAIKMLFHPYEPVYLFGRRLPFTPGLIPRRRDELAEQMGRMVVEHLITPESIKQKLITSSVKVEANRMAGNLLDKTIFSEMKVEDAFRKMGMADVPDMLVHRMADKSSNLVEEWYLANQEKPLISFLPESLGEKVEGKLPDVSQYILDKGIAFFASAEGKARLQKMADDFMVERGKLGGFMQMLLGNVNLGEKLQPEIIKFLANPGTKDTLTNILVNEWDKLKNMKVSEAERYYSLEEQKNLIHKGIFYAYGKIGLSAMPLSKLTGEWSETIKGRLLPELIEAISERIINQVPAIMEKFKLEEIVRDQVASFPVSRLEEMVLSITRSELKMITYLGALLGGLIGVFQGVFMIIMN